MRYMLGLESDEPGNGSWTLRERTADGAILQVTFAYSDGSNTTTSRFVANRSVPGRVETEAGVLVFAGTGAGGEVVFEPSKEYAAAIAAMEHKVFTRELLAFALSHIPLSYVQVALELWPHERMSSIMGMHVLGVTPDDMREALAQNPNISPSTVMMSINRWRHQ